MSLRLSKRTVQLAGIVTILAMTGGFALASISGPGGSSNNINVNSGGTTTVTYSSTAWSTVAPSVGTVTVVANCVNGLANGGSCTLNDQSLNFVYTQAPTTCPSSGASDTFSFASTTSVVNPGTPGTFTSTYTTTTCNPSGQTLDLSVDFGLPTTSVTVTSVDVTITGNF